MRSTIRNAAALALLFAIPVVVGPIRPASAFEVAKGCDAPPSSGGGKTFYIDPQHGSMTNDGSETKPWRTLAEVLAPQNRLLAKRKLGGKASDGTLAVDGEGPIKPGDTLVLMSGEHGDVVVNQVENDSFISVVAGKQQTPVIPDHVRGQVVALALRRPEISKRSYDG